MFKSLFNKKAKDVIISESMYSSIYKLENNHEEVLLRIHPKKRNSYNAMIKKDTLVEQNGNQLNITDIVLIVNSWESDELVQLNYSEIKDIPITQIDSEKAVKGFDENSEPIIYKMKDGSLRIVFFSMPPTDNNGFDMDDFSFDFIDSIECGITHDDREVFHIPKAKEDTIDKIIHFLSSYHINH